MSIAAESEQGKVQKLRERLREMTEQELIRYGTDARDLCRDRLGREAFEWQLQEARAEWKRRHPPQCKTAG